jgi:Na+/H+-dicarboxylate symporter
MKGYIPLPFQLVAILLFVVLFGSLLPLLVLQSCYTFSLCFKELLGLFLPFMVFAFVFVGISSFKQKAPLILSILISCITVSNALIASLAYFVVSTCIPLVITTNPGQIICQIKCLEPFFSFKLPTIISSEKALLLAIAMGILVSFIHLPRLEAILHTMKEYVQKILVVGFIPFLPLYVLGFLLKIQYEGIFSQLASEYGKAFILIFIFQSTYIFMMYLIAGGGNFRTTIEYIKNSMPTYLTGFSTMSSTATIPISIESAIKNKVNIPFAHLAVPIMANVSLIGDCISTPSLALLTHYIFLGVLPTMSEYAVFVCYFALTMLAAAGVPGGGIIVMIPILKSLLHFNAEMISIIMTLYLIQDPLGTAGNVMGDGALVIMINKLLKKLRIVS